MVLVAVKSSKKRLISQFISRIKHEPVYGGLNLQFCRYVGVQEKCLMTPYCVTASYGTVKNYWGKASISVGAG